MIAPATLEQLEKLALQKLSHDGKVVFDDLEPIGKATWMAYIKGFMECAEYLLQPEVSKEIVCSSCLSFGISDPNCICCYQNRYPTTEREIDFCRVCGSPDND